MAKEPAAKPADENNTTGTALAAFVAPGAVAEFSSSELEGLVSLGYSEDAADSLVPILAIIQENSGEAKERHPKYINGAKPGMLIIRATKKVIDVVEPIPVIPCAFTHYWVQWDGEPGEGRVVTQWPFDEGTRDAREVPDPQNEERKLWRMPDGTRLVDTRYWYCLVLLDGVWKSLVIPMGGTNHTVSRTWNGQQQDKRLPVQGSPKAPSWFFVYGLSTRYNNRGTQSWFTYELSELGWVQDPALRAQGRAINESVMKGVIDVDVKSESSETAPAGDESEIS